MTFREEFSINARPLRYLSITLLSHFARCPRKFFYETLVGLSSTEHIALKFGEAIHAGLPYAFLGDLVSAMKGFDSVWRDREGDDKRNRENAIAMFLHHLESHANGRSLYTLETPPSGLHQVSDVVNEYEVPFALDIGLSIPLFGRVDGLVRHRDTHELWGLEYKTTSELSARFPSQFTFNSQVVGYTTALRAYGLDVAGVMVEGILVPKVLKTKETKQASLCTPFHVTPDMCSDFLSWARYYGSLILACIESREFPKDLSACTSYPQFGTPGYECDFLPLCLAPDDDWVSRKSMYTQSTVDRYESFFKLSLPQLGVPPSP